MKPNLYQSLTELISDRIWPEIYVSNLWLPERTLKVNPKQENAHLVVCLLRWGRSVVPRRLRWSTLPCGLQSCCGWNNGFKDNIGLGGGGRWSTTRGCHRGITEWPVEGWHGPTCFFFFLTHKCIMTAIAHWSCCFICMHGGSWGGRASSEFMDDGSGVRDVVGGALVVIVARDPRRPHRR